MKRPLIYLALLLLMPLTAWANLPAGTTVYLNTTDFGGGHTCYYIYLSSKGQWLLMSEVPNRSGYYSYVATGELQENVRFGYYKNDPGSCQASMGWTDNIIQIKNSDEPLIKSASMTCYHPTSASDGKWEDGSWSADEITDVTYQVIESNCVDSMATIEVTVTLTGSTATLKLSGPMFANERLLPKCATPYVFKYRTSGKADAPVQMTLTASACSNTAGTSINNTKTINIDRPQINCTDSISTDSICNTIATTTLSATREADSIQWYDTDKQPCFTNQKSITVPVVDGALYTVDYFSTSISSHNNLMANGSFEDGYSGFYSDYEPISKSGTPVVDPYNVYGGDYDNGSKYGKYYAIMTNANRFWPGDGINNGYADITAHEGQYFLVADATNEGYAWKATTADNPKLVLVKDQEYVFSYWAAYPNLPDQYSDPCAELWFVIEYKDEQGQTQAEKLGKFDLEDVKPDHDWYQRTTTWKAPCNSTDVSIGVKDLTQSAEGNDFCLDDIIFQAVTGEQKVFAHRDVFTIVTKECGSTIVDTICLGETYSQHGFNVTPKQAGDTVVTREEPTETVVLKLHVEAPISVSASPVAAICNHAGGTILVPFTIVSGLPATYSMTADNPDVTPVVGADIPMNNQFAVDIPNPIVSGTRTLTFTFDNRAHRCNDQQLVVTLTFVECKGLMDTTCVGQPYNKGGFTHPADQPGTFKLENGTTDTLYLTVLINPEVKVESVKKSECNITSADVDVPYTIVAGENLSYSLNFDAVLPPSSGKLTGSALHFTIPQSGLNRTITGTLSYQYMNRCISTSTFTIRVSNGTLGVYRKWDNVLFVDNHDDQYVAFQWYRNNQLLDGATKQSLYTGNDPMWHDGNEYYVIVQYADGTTEQSCPVRFDDALRSAPLYPGNNSYPSAQRLIYRVGPNMHIIETTYTDGSTDIQKVIIR